MPTMVAEKSSLIMIDPKGCHTVDLRESIEIHSTHTEDDKNSQTDYSTDDGGYGWLVCAGAFVGMFTVYGITNCW